MASDLLQKMDFKHVWWKTCGKFQRKSLFSK